MATTFESIYARCAVTHRVLEAAARRLEQNF